MPQNISLFRIFYFVSSIEICFEKLSVNCITFSHIICTYIALEIKYNANSFGQTVIPDVLYTKFRVLTYLIYNMLVTWSLNYKKCISSSVFPFKNNNIACCRSVYFNSFNCFVVLNPDYLLLLSLIHIWRCRRIERCRSRWSPYH